MNISRLTCVCHAAKPQSTMPCNHVMSNLVELGVLTVQKKKKKKGKMEWNFEYNIIQKHTLTFAIEPHVIYFVEQGVDTGFNKEFLASAVESGLTAVVSIFTLL